MATVGDLVLVYKEEIPATFARIEDIWADKKSDWYHVKLLVLQIPVVEAVWILREAYINGEEFTMNGVRTRLEKVEGPSQLREYPPSADGDLDKDSSRGGGKVISLFDRKKD